MVVTSEMLEDMEAKGAGKVAAALRANAAPGTVAPTSASESSSPDPVREEKPFKGFGKTP